MSILRFLILADCICVLLVFGSCKKMIEVAPPINQLEQELVFSDSLLATASVTGLYSRMVNNQNNFGSFVLTVFPGLTSDELYNTATQATYDPFYANAIPTNNTTVRLAFYEQVYRNIYHTNACLEGLAKASNISADALNQLTGEMKFMRAFHYFYLVNIFGDVPLILKTNFDENSTIPRTSAQAIYKQIEKDLDDAMNLLSTSYPISGRVRPNKWTAAALSSRVHLYLGNWAKAEELSSAVINSNSYSLVVNIDSAFLNNNKEAIWQLQMSNGVFVQEATTFIPASATTRPALGITLQLYNSFENNDKRKASWIKQSTATGGPFYYPNKYKERLSSTVTSNAKEQITFLRLAEQYLIRSEARAQQNNLIGSIADLNVVRIRAGLTALSNSLAQSAVLTAIEKERKIELMIELGHRWFDLKRTGKADAVLAPIKTAWQSTDVLFPIPHLERLRNPDLTQNPGY